MWVPFVTSRRSNCQDCVLQWSQQRSKWHNVVIMALEKLIISILAQLVWHHTRPLMNHSKMSPFEDWQAIFEKNNWMNIPCRPDSNLLRASSLPAAQWLRDYIWDVSTQIGWWQNTGQVNIQKLDLLILNMRHQKFASCEILWSDTLTEHFIRYTLQVPNQVAGVCVWFRSVEFRDVFSLQFFVATYGFCEGKYLLKCYIQCVRSI